MKNKLPKIFLCVIVAALLVSALPIFGASAETVDVPQNILDKLITYNCRAANVDTVQKWIDTELTANAGVSSEFYIIALRQLGDYDFSSYRSALKQYLSENKVSSASSREKYALALIASGSDDEYISNTLNDSVGEQGIMSWVFGLHIMNNGYTSEKHSTETVIEQILSMQQSDGGWSITGTRGDVDATAITIQALALHYETAEVKSAVDNALSFLSENQKDNGDYASYGVNNSESAAQVLVALSSLGIDCTIDERFIKNGYNLFDSIERFRLEDGTFSHVIDGESNKNATVQVFYSMVSYIRMISGKTGLYIFDSSENNDNSSVSQNETISESSELEIFTESDPESVSSDITSDGEKTSYKVWAIIAVFSVAAISCLVMFLAKKSNKQNFILILVIAVIAVIFVLVTDFQSTDDYYQNADTSKQNPIGTVTISIRCDTIAGNSNESHIPENGIILSETECDIQDGDTVYDVLLEVTAKNKIHLETNGSAEMTYVEGIANIYEFDFGDLSGWIYHVNDASSSVSCGEYKLKDGDNIEWYYTCSLGEDIE